MFEVCNDSARTPLMALGLIVFGISATPAIIIYKKMAAFCLQFDSLGKKVDEKKEM